MNFGVAMKREKGVLSEWSSHWKETVSLLEESIVWGAILTFGTKRVGCEFPLKVSNQEQRARHFDVQSVQVKVGRVELSRFECAGTTTTETMKWLLDDWRRLAFNCLQAVTHSGRFAGTDRASGVCATWNSEPKIAGTHRKCLLVAKQLTVEETRSNSVYCCCRPDADVALGCQCHCCGEIGSMKFARRRVYSLAKRCTTRIPSDG